MKVRKPKGKQLQLHNDGHLSIFTVGCGGAFSKTLHQNNILIIKGDTHVLVDCGTKTPSVLHRHGVPITDVNTFLITHSHADHIGGLEEAMLMARYVARRKPRIIITPEYQKILWNNSLRGGCEHNERHNGKSLEFDDFWEIVRPKAVRGAFRTMHSVDLDGLKLTLIRTRHFPEQAESWKDSFYSVGLLIDDRVLFSGDTQYDPEFINRIFDSHKLDAIFHDVQFFTGGVHASLEEISQFRPEVRERMLLMHYGDSWEQHKATVESHGFAGFAAEHRYYDFT